MFEHYYRELFNFLASKVSDRDAAADLAQESYARALTVGRSGQVVLDPRAMPYRIARNLVIDQYRQSKSRRHESLDNLADDDLAALPRCQQPEDLVAFNQYASALLGAIESLPPRCREAFILNRFDGLSHLEVTGHMGISRNMVAQHIIRGVLVCKACDDRFHGRSTA